MKNLCNFIFILNLSISALIYADTTKVTKQHVATKKLQKGAIHLDINLTNRQDTHANNSTNLYTSQSAKQSRPTEESPLLNRISEMWQKNIEIQKQLQEKSSQFFLSNKWYLLGGTLLCSYGLLLYFLISGNSYLSDGNLWSSWRQETPFDQVLAIPQQQFSQDLIREIQRRYTDANSIGDIVKQLSIFLIKIDQEEHDLKWYQKFYSWISYLRLSKLVPISQFRYAKINERLQRIAYYKNVFNAWTANYQLQQVERLRCPILTQYPDLTDTNELLQIEMTLRIVDYWLKQEKCRIPRFS